MEDRISIFCKTLSSYCKHLQSSCEVLKESVQRRPIPLDSASSSFLQCMDRRVSSTNGDLNLLYSMVLGTVSFEELLGHCNEVYKKNQSDLQDLEDHLLSMGYVHDKDLDDGAESLDLSTPTVIKSNVLRRLSEKFDELQTVSVSHASSVSIERLEKDLFDDSICLQDLGLSDVCLATLASEGCDELASPKFPFMNSAKKSHGSRVLSEPEKVGEKLLTEHATVDGSALYLEALEGHHDLERTATKDIIKISKEEYDGLPFYIKNLAQWEDLQEAVEKMNSVICKKGPRESYSFNQEDLSSMGLGLKGRSFLLLLLRLNRLTVVTIDGSIAYHITDEN